MRDKIDPLYFQLFDFTPSKGDLKRIEIIQAAIECLAQVGIEGLTFEAVGNLIGVKPSHIAYYFPDKNDIVDSAFKFMMGTMQKYSVEAIRTETTSQKRLKAYVESWFRYIDENPSHRPLITLYHYYCSRFEKHRTLYRELTQSGVQRIAAIIAVEFSDEKSARDAAEQIMNLLLGNMFRFLVFDQSATSLRKMRKDAYEKSASIAFPQTSGVASSHTGTL